MKSAISRTAVDPSSKAPNGIACFDEITGGGAASRAHYVADGWTRVGQDHICAAIPSAWRAGLQRAWDFRGF